MSLNEQTSIKIVVMIQKNNNNNILIITHFLINLGAYVFV